MGNGNFYEIFAKISLQNVLKSKNTFGFKEIFYDCIFVMYRCNLLNGTIEKIDLENICDKILNDYEEFISKESS